MRKFQVTVNGKLYDVGVLEVGETAPAQIVVPAPAQAAPAPAPAPQAAAAPAPAQQTASAAPIDAKEVISAPMPGKILSIKVKVGQTVKSGDLILILEAMKMENEIFCGESGVVKEIRIKESDSVNPGDVLVAIG
ncbi:MAG: biotin/lipoyl-binding protein [Peptococcaceae bacterium]|nr:biotin/lipoyl-binding protein [Peptococcaceae bacterium]